MARVVTRLLARVVTRVVARAWATFNGSMLCVRPSAVQYNDKYLRN